MTKQDWIEMVNLTTQKDWLDWIVIIISIASPLITLFAVVYAAKSAKSAKDAIEITKQINEDAKSERELLRLPIFELQNVVFYSKLTFDLVNINVPYPVSITNFGAALGNKKLDTKKINNHLVKVEMEHSLEEGKSILMTLNFTTLSHDKYKIKFNMRRDNNTLFIDDYERQKIIA